MSDRHYFCIKAASISAIILIISALGSWAAHRPMLSGLAHLWVVSDPIAHADAIVILGGGLEVRPIAAADLYKRGLANQILVSNIKLGPIEKLAILPPQTELTRKILVSLGVPSQVIFNFGKDLSSTNAEAHALADWMKATGAMSVIIPTEIFPSRRVRWIFKRVLGHDGIDVSVAAYAPPQYNIDDWWQDDVGIVEFQNEVLKYLYYRIRY